MDRIVDFELKKTKNNNAVLIEKPHSNLFTRSFYFQKEITTISNKLHSIVVTDSIVTH